MCTLKTTFYFLCLSLLVSSCATLPRNPPPLDLIHEAEIVHAPGVRAWGGKASKRFQQDIIESLHQEKEGDYLDPVTGKKSYSALAISGGGSNGAFGAGFLCGWSARGDRPSFKLVSGISTGALIAPFAFLGSEYDNQLKKLYTNVSTGDIVSRNSVLGILTRDESFTDSKPLINLIRKSVDFSILQEINKAHERGRRLYIGTTHMDAQRLVVWNMGLIAKIGTEEALDLFQKVMLASASIPVAMPPVFFDIEVDGERYDEMHTDGGTTTQVFFHAGTIDLSAATKTIDTEALNTFANLYVLRNGQTSSVPEPISRNIQAISARTLDTSIKASALNNLFRMYVFAKRDKSRIFYTDIPDEYVSESSELFDRKEMRKLFKVGVELGSSKEPWRDELPGIGITNDSIDGKLN